MKTKTKKTNCFTIHPIAFYTAIKVDRGTVIYHQIYKVFFTAINYLFLVYNGYSPGCDYNFVNYIVAAVMISADDSVPVK